MKIKTFQALTMQDAIRAIKEDLGSDAVILSSKRVRKGGHLFGLFGRSMIEVAAAVELDQRTSGSGRSAPSSPPKPASRHGDIPQGEDSAFSRTLQASLTAATPPKGDASQPGQPRRRQERKPPQQARGSASGTRPVGEQPQPKPPDIDALTRPLPRSPAQAWPPRKEWERIRRELSDIRELLLQSGSAHPRAWLEQLPSKLVPWYDTLVRNGLEPGTARTVLLEANGQPNVARTDDDLEIRRALHHILTRHVLVSGPLLPTGQQKKAVLFVGPTGVGKTTTIAKLAAQYRLKERRRVSLITLDTYRVAAVEQLRMYASVIGVTMDVALTYEEALDCLRRRQHAELVLIDTAGHSPMDSEGMEEVQRMATVDHPLEVHLVLSATTRNQDLLDSLARYASMPINRLLFTKLDETTTFGNLLELMRRTSLPLSYFTTGQRVPDDLEVVTQERFADLVLDGFPMRSPDRASLEEEEMEGRDAEDHSSTSSDRHHYE